MILIELWHGDSRERIRDIPDESIDLVVTDPPYQLITGNRNGSARTPGSGPFGRIGLSTKPKGGFMGKDWDASGVAFDPEFWSEVLRVLRRGRQVKALGSTRTYHRMGQAWRRAGFVDVKLEAWMYASGMPKSHNLAKAIDRHFGVKGKVVGHKRGVVGENLNDLVHGGPVRTMDQKGAKGVGAYGVGAKQKSAMIPVIAPSTPEAQLWDGYGTGLKPAWEAILVATRPLTQ